MVWTVNCFWQILHLSFTLNIQDLNPEAEFIAILYVYSTIPVSKFLQLSFICLFIYLIPLLSPKKTQCSNNNVFQEFLHHGKQRTSSFPCFKFYMENKQKSPIFSSFQHHQVSQSLVDSGINLNNALQLVYLLQLHTEGNNGKRRHGISGIVTASFQYQQKSLDLDPGALCQKRNTGISHVERETAFFFHCKTITEIQGSSIIKENYPKSYHPHVFLGIYSMFYHTCIFYIVSIVICSQFLYLFFA